MGNVIEGWWKQATGKIKETWGDLTDDEVTEIDGRREKLSGKLQERYGWAEKEAEDRIDEFVKQNKDAA